MSTVSDRGSGRSIAMARVIPVVLFATLFVGLAPRKAALDSKEHKQFGALIARLSEPAGHFDSDNLISNETSYLHVIGKLRDLGVRGGVYLGVGPDQNFTYIAKIRPRMAIMIDIRRDAVLQHLLYKALFERAHNRIEYACLFFGKPFPKTRGWEQKGIKELIDYLDNTPSDSKFFDRAAADVRRSVQRYGVPLSSADLETINRIHRAFYSSGLDIRYSTHYRPPRSIYPTYRDLLLEHDLAGQIQNYLNSEDDFKFLKQLQEQDLVVPVVGDLSGLQSLKAIGKYVAEIKERVSAFYVSNVEFYLSRQGSFDSFVENLKSLPIDERSVIIRSYFNYYATPHPQAVDGHNSTQLLERIEDLLNQCAKGECESYNDIVTKNSIDLQP
ncbi:MAG TPA: hypothetical protein VFV34_14775 [Blastocatellia bacterium]|nr:hypothetical protein [Blastocatellia bacterium]